MSQRINPDPAKIEGVFLMPSDIMRHASDKPVMYIRHKPAFLKYLYENNLDSILGPMSAEQWEDEYVKWLDKNPQE